MVRQKPRFLNILTILLPALELAKQLYLYFIVFAGQSYDVWYFPFQLCSVHMYLLILLRLLPVETTGCAGIAPAEKGPAGAGTVRQGKEPAKAGAVLTEKGPDGARAAAVLPGKGSRKKNGLSLWIRQAALSYIRDFGLLGGVLALLVNEGFTGTGHLFLAVHGYVWHLLLILLSLFIGFSGRSAAPGTRFRDEALLFLFTAALAEGINVLLHPFGDCDMFYISPYHLSSQPVFHEIDALIGRPAGILIYLASVLLGARLVRRMYQLLGAA